MPKKYFIAVQILQVLNKNVPGLKARCDILEKEKLSLQNDMDGLKKLLDTLTEQLQEAQAQNKEKDERLYKAQCELIEVYKKQN
jgi:chromosome segregation ATPase